MIRPLLGLAALLLAGCETAEPEFISYILINSQGETQMCGPNYYTDKHSQRVCLSRHQAEGFSILEIVVN